MVRVRRLSGSSPQVRRDAITRGGRGLDGRPSGQDRPNHLTLGRFVTASGRRRDGRWHAIAVSLSYIDYKRVDEVCGMPAGKGTSLGGPWSDHLEGQVWEMRLRLALVAVRVTY